MTTIKFDELKVGMTVIDSAGDKVTIDEIEDIHNIHVSGENSIGICCLVENCKLYDPLFKIGEE